MYNTSRLTAMAEKKRQTAFRLDPVLIGRLKEAARRESISVNEYVSRTLLEATREILSAEEKEAEKRATEAFLDTFYGSWSGPETAEEIMTAIKENSSSRPAPVL